MSDKEEFIDLANRVMEEAVEKAAELLCSKPQIAEVILKQLLRCDPEHQAGLQLLGLCKHRLGQNEEAIEIIKTALELKPDDADNLNNLGLAYAGLGHHERAIEVMERAIELNPNQFLFKNNLALQYKNIGNYDKAISCLKEAIAAHERPQLWLNLGGIYGELRNVPEARWCFENALRIDPEYPAAHVDMAFVEHLSGNWQRGFEEYEWRFWYYPQMKYYLNEYDMTKVWDGRSSLEGKRLLVYGEQGMGDIIQFARYAKDLRDVGAHVIIHCPPELDAVIKRIDGVAETTTRDIVTGKGDPFPEYDYQLSMMSVPHLLKHQEIDGRPYITPATEAFGDYVKQDHPDTLNIGVVWAGSPAHPHDKKRSIPLKFFKGISETKGVQLFSLQMDLRKRQYGVTYRNVASDEPTPNDVCTEKFQPDCDIVDYCEGLIEFNLIDLTNMIQTFDDTATILAGLDLVICCDTAVAHLAGSMGVPVWVLVPYNPDWRWGLEGENTQWYNSMRLFRQTERDNWQDVFEVVEKELNAHLLQNQR